MSDFFVSEKHSLVIVQRGEPLRAPYSLEQAAHLTGVHPDLLRHYCRLGLLGDWRREEELDGSFDDDALYEVRRIEHLRRHHGVNLRALPLLCELLHEVERLRAEVRFLRGP